MSDGAPSVAVDARAVRIAVLLAAVGVVLVNLLAIVRAPWEGDSFGSGTAEWLLLANENNPGTWLSSALLLLGAVTLLWCGAGETGARRRWWWGLAAVVALLSLDESASLHERLDDYLDVPDGGLVTYAWVIPGFVAIVATVALFWRFVFSLPRATRLGFIGAAALFLLGAVGFETAAGWWDDDHGRDNAAYYLISTVEEALELAGAAVALLVALEHVRRLGPMTAQVTPAVRAEAGAGRRAPLASGATGTPTAPPPPPPPAGADAAAAPSGAS